MKKHIFAFIFAIGILASVNVGHAYAQSLAFRVEVPFEFNASNKTLPAGTYIVRPVTSDRRVWDLQSVDNSPNIFLLSGSLSNARGSEDVGLTFRRYGSQHFLIGFRSNIYEVGLPTSSSEKGLRRTLIGAAKDNVAIVEAGSPR